MKLAATVASPIHSRNLCDYIPLKYKELKVIFMNKLRTAEV
jgi:hypothetical protein